MLAREMMDDTGACSGLCAGNAGRARFVLNHSRNSAKL
jgi:hypothetical protein